MGCATAKPPPVQQPAQVVHDVVTVPKNIYPDVPADDLMCADEPAVPPAVKTEVQAGLWTNELIDAGDDCRKKLRTIRDIVSKWPKS